MTESLRAYMRQVSYFLKQYPVSDRHLFPLQYLSSLQPRLDFPEIALTPEYVLRTSLFCRYCPQHVDDSASLLSLRGLPPSKLQQRHLLCRIREIPRSPPENIEQSPLRVQPAQDLQERPGRQRPRSRLGEAKPLRARRSGYPVEQTSQTTSGLGRPSQPRDHDFARPMIRAAWRAVTGAWSWSPA